MKTRAALLRAAPGAWSVEDVELDEPGPTEVLVEMVATGICRSDDHIVTGDTRVFHLPLVGGHEGAGIVRQVGDQVTGFAEGDHVLTAFIPACGRCRWCATGAQNLCNNGGEILKGNQLDGTYRMHTTDGLDVGTLSMLGTFAEWQVVDQLSLIKVENDVPLGVAALVACGVQTGFGSAATAGDVQRGDVVFVAGVGGVGMNAVQGAVLSGAAHVIACDPVPQKQEWALQFGATEAFGSVKEATSRIRDLTDGQGADVGILTAGQVHNDLIGAGYKAVRKAGTLVVTGVSPDAEEGVIPGVNAFMLSMFQKRIQGALYGMKSPREAMPTLLNLYRAGRLKLDELITGEYTLDQVNEACEDMRAGKNIRGVIRFDRAPRLRLAASAENSLAPSPA